MSSNTKLAAERLLKLADAIEEEAYDNTYFVCDSCNHTASLKTINEKRKIAAKESNVLHVANVTVNDDVTCVACGGKMSYVPTDSSMKFYVEAENDEEEDKEKEIDIFEPVDEQGNKDKGEGLPGEGPLPEDVSLEEKPMEKTPEEEEVIPSVEEETKMKEDVTEDSDIPPMDEEKADEIPPEDDEEEKDTVPPMEDTDITLEEEDKVTPPEDSDIVSPDDTGEPVVEETVEDIMEEKPKKKKNKDIDIPQDEVPKFEKIPKDANDAFWVSVKKYSI